LSTSSSVTAKSAAFRENVPTVMDTREESPTWIMPFLAPYARTAGAVIERNPATTPIAAGNARLVARFINAYPR
jgi:hypothetical protein